MTDLLKLGSCPDSWGVWYADDPRQPPWERFLDELARVGYEYLELGPYGYLPTDAPRLQDELAARGLRSPAARCTATAACTAPTSSTRSPAGPSRSPR